MLRIVVLAESLVRRVNDPAAIGGRRSQAHAAIDHAAMAEPRSIRNVNAVEEFAATVFDANQVVCLTELRGIQVIQAANPRPADITEAGIGWRSDAVLVEVRSGDGKVVGDCEIAEPGP